MDGRKKEETRVYPSAAFCRRLKEWANQRGRVLRQWEVRGPSVPRRHTTNNRWKVEKRNEKKKKKNEHCRETGLSAAAFVRILKSWRHEWFKKRKTQPLNRRRICMAYMQLRHLLRENIWAFDNFLWSQEREKRRKRRKVKKKTEIFQSRYTPLYPLYHTHTTPSTVYDDTPHPSWA